MNYPSIRIEGAILSPDILDRIDDAPGQRPADFGLDGATKVKDEIARAWADGQDARLPSPGVAGCCRGEPHRALPSGLARVRERASAMV